MKTRQEIINSYRNGDLCERLDIFLMYRYFRNDFMEIEHHDLEFADRRSRWKILQYDPDKSRPSFEKRD